MNNKNKRREELLQFIRRRSGRRFLVAVMVREFGVSERTIQSDLSVLEVFGQIKRTPSYTIHCTDKTEILSSIRAAASGNLINRMSDNLGLVRG